MPNVYPDWEIYIFYDMTVSRKMIEILKTYRYVTIIDMSNR